jgi:lathosterol oxidase
VIAALDLATGTWMRSRRVRGAGPAPGQQRHEFGHSMVAALVFSAVGTGVLVGHRLGLLRVYTDPAEFGLTWLVASFFVLVVLHDTWFYWTHRLMHGPRLFRGVHRTHHLSVAPTPWAAYSFSAPEAFVQALFLPVALLAVPAHPAVLFAWMAWMVLRNVMGHCGVELLPRAWLAGWWGRWCTTTLHHDMHHAAGHHNYGLYFLWWDRWCGTEHPDYRKRLAALVAGMDASTLPVPDAGLSRGCVSSPNTASSAPEANMLRPTNQNAAST